jgi:hypothetical protein
VPRGSHAHRAEDPHHTQHGLWKVYAPAL